MTAAAFFALRSDQRLAEIFDRFYDLQNEAMTAECYADESPESMDHYRSCMARLDAFKNRHFAELSRVEE